MLSEEVRFLAEILKIYSPSSKEGKLANLLANKMRDLGFKDVYVDNADNVIGELGEGKPRILFCGHTDTVPGYLKVRVDDKYIRGRGAVDAKGPLAAMLWALVRLKGKEDFGKVIFAAVSDEEGNGKGIKELASRGIDVDFAIFGEPSGVENITLGYKGRVSLALKCIGRSAHASSPWMGINAIEKLYEFWKNFKEALNSQGRDKYNSITCCITKIYGGSSHNVVPDECTAILDIRIPPSLKAQEIVKKIQDLSKMYQENLLDSKLELKILDMTEPYEVDKRNLVVRALSIAINEVYGKSPNLIRKTGTGDMNVIGNSLKIPCVTYGPGRAHLAHTQEERIEISEYMIGISIYQRTLIHLSRLYNKVSKGELKLKSPYLG